MFSGTGGAGGGSPLPSWHTARPLAFAGAALRDPRLTDAGERSREIVRIVGALRFLRQITPGARPQGAPAEVAAIQSAAPEAAALFFNPEQVRGGVRQSAWDFRQSPEATAMGLLAVCEVLESLREVSAPPRGTASEQR